MRRLAPFLLRAVFLSDPGQRDITLHVPFTMMMDEEGTLGLLVEQLDLGATAAGCGRGPINSQLR